MFYLSSTAFSNSIINSLPAPAFIVREKTAMNLSIHSRFSNRLLLNARATPLSAANRNFLCGSIVVRVEAEK
jgi:hypothetical protein